jgi:hypothetical protein
MNKIKIKNRLFAQNNKKTSLSRPKKKQKKRKRILSPFKSKNKSRTKRNIKKKMFAQGNISNKNIKQMIPRDVFYHDPMIYSSVLYKYNNKTASKVGSKMNQLRKNILTEIKTHSHEKKGVLPSYSRSLKKHRESSRWKKPNYLSSKKSIRLKPRVSTKVAKESHDKQQKDSIFQIIKGINKSPKTKKIRNTSPFATLKKNRNYSSSKNKKRLRSKASMENKKSVKNYSLNLITPNKVKVLDKKMRSGSFQNFFGQKIKKKKKFKHNPGGRPCTSGMILPKVHREYDLDQIRSKKNIITKINKKMDKLKEKFCIDPYKYKPNYFDMRNHKDTLKKNKQQTPININLDQIERSSSKDSRLDSITLKESTEELNKRLLSELKESQLKNALFAEMINDLKNQIQHLKGNKLQSFSFKNLAIDKKQGSPTPGSGGLLG